MAVEQPQAQALKQSVKSDKNDSAIEVNVEVAQKSTPAAKTEPAPAAAAEAKPAVEAAPSAAAPGSLIGRADAIIRTNVYWAMGAGAVPVPIVDLLAVSGVQMKMLSELSALYGMSFREDVAKKIVGSLFSSVLGVGIGAAVGASLSKLIPTVGTALGLLTVPAAAGAFTLTTGKVFVMHFEAGGTLLDFDPAAMRAHFKLEFEKARDIVARMKAEEEAKSAKPS